jgi:hypothetical protein
MRVHPRIDGGIAFQGAVESQQAGVHSGYMLNAEVRGQGSGVRERSAADWRFRDSCGNSYDQQ